MGFSHQNLIGFALSSSPIASGRYFLHFCCYVLFLLRYFMAKLELFFFLLLHTMTAFPSSVEVGSSVAAVFSPLCWMPDTMAFLKRIWAFIWKKIIIKKQNYIVFLEQLLTKVQLKSFDYLIS